MFSGKIALVTGAGRGSEKQLPWSLQKRELLW